MLTHKTKALRPLVAALFLSLPLTQTATAQAAGQTSVTLDQARAIGRQALATGNTGLALQVAAGLLQADPKDEMAHFMMAAALAQANAHDDSRRAAAKAYRYTDTSIRKFEAAQLAARMAVQGDRPTLAQLWLRRAANHAPNDQADAIVASDYKKLRQINPWSFRLNGGVTPTDNLNNGTENDFLVIDGGADGGRIINGAPLSGLEAHVDAQVSYRLRADKTSATQWNARLYLKEVRLSDEARALSPTTEAGDFAYAYIDTGVRHAFAIGDSGTTAAVSGNIGQTWSGGTPYTRFARIKGEIGYKLGDQTRIGFSASVDQQNRVNNRSQDRTILGFGANLTHKLGSGDTAGLSLYVRDTNSNGFNAKNEYAAIRASYALGKAIGPVSISGGLTYSYRNYDTFFASIDPNTNAFVASRRQDNGLTADVTFVFNDIHYAGFVPSLTVRARSTSSNISLYETQAVSVSMGIRSKF